jgi:hypothetical protein
MLDFRISLIDRIRGLSFGFGFKNVGSFQGLDRGLTSDVGFWFFFGYFESLIDQLTIQTYNSAAGGARALSLDLAVAVFTVAIVEIR